MRFGLRCLDTMWTWSEVRWQLGLLSALFCRRRDCILRLWNYPGVENFSRVDPLYRNQYSFTIPVLATLLSPTCTKFIELLRTDLKGELPFQVWGVLHTMVFFFNHWCPCSLFARKISQNRKLPILLTCNWVMLLQISIWFILLSACGILWTITFFLLWFKKSSHKSQREVKCLMLTEGFWFCSR